MIFSRQASTTVGIHVHGPFGGQDVALQAVLSDPTKVHILLPSSGATELVALQGTAGWKNIMATGMFNNYPIIIKISINIYKYL